MSDVLLQTTNLVKHFPVKKGTGVVHAVDDVNLTVKKGETLAVVGESGCGKSTLARLMLRMHEPTSGTVHFEGANLQALNGRELRAKRRDMQLIFQDPYASLDTRQKVAGIITEPMAIHGVGDKKSRKERLFELLDLVGLGPEAADKYPHEFSGGQRQRIGIARAIVLEPKLVVADEPVSALDVSIQSQILNLMVEVKNRLNLSYVFISHDLAVVKHISDRVCVMYLGQNVELAGVDELYANPLHPYTRALLAAIPRPDFTAREKKPLEGDIPDPSNPPAGCRFHPRCPEAMDVCRVEEPIERVVKNEAGKHYVSCHLY